MKADPCTLTGTGKAFSETAVLGNSRRQESFYEAEFFTWGLGPASPHRGRVQYFLLARRTASGTLVEKVQNVAPMFEKQKLAGIFDRLEGNVRIAGFQFFDRVGRHRSVFGSVDEMGRHFFRHPLKQITLILKLMVSHLLHVTQMRGTPRRRYRFRRYLEGFQNLWVFCCFKIARRRAINGSQEPMCPGTATELEAGLYDER